jgi:hypothetical protein
MTVRVKLLDGLCWVLLVIAVLEACGPSLTQPSSEDISGRWATTEPIGILSDVQISITQLRDGTVSGEWSATTLSPNPSCPPDLGPSPIGSVSGTNTVLGVYLSLLGAGDFEGQIVDSETLEGSFVSCSSVYAVVWSFVGPLPPP